MPQDSFLSQPGDAEEPDGSPLPRVAGDGAGLAGCSDDQLMGIMSAARRMEARAAWTLLAAVREFAARHDGSRPADEDAGRADEILSRQAPGLTFGEMRAAAHKLVLKLDPEAVRKRKEAARRDAQVRRFREPSGNAGMVARELPPDEVLASWQHVEQRALDLRAAGMPTPPAKPAGSGCWTATTPATWPPPRPATRPPGGASPR